MRLSKLKRVLHYDPETGLFTSISRRKGGRKPGTVAGCVRDGWRTITILGEQHPASRLAWFYMTGRWPKRQVDHKNRNRGDDRWKNLRLATRAQQMQNTRVHGRNKIGTRGVRLHKTGRWEARICVKTQPLYLGLYDTKELADLAYKNAAEKHFGEFAYHLSGE